MGAVSTSAHARGGSVLGVIPTALEPVEVSGGFGTLEELLEEDELLQECKAQNAKLTELCAPSPRRASFFSATSSRPFFFLPESMCLCVCAQRKHTHTKLP